MTTQHSTIIIGILALMAGLIMGYTSGSAGHRPGFGMMGAPNHMKGDGDARGMRGAMGGMIMGLEGKTGDELDKAFLDGMIVHHEGAVQMAKTLIAGTKRPELITMGNAIISAQSTEIEQMKAWRAEWFK